MLRFPTSKISILMVAAVCGLLAAASPALARYVLKAYSSQDIAGLDDLGNVDTTLGGESAGKVYKDDVTGVILQINRALVENEFGFSLIIRNQGLTMFDPESYEALTSTSDYTQYFVRTTLFQGTQNETGWGAVQVKIYDPKLAPAPVP